MLHSNFFIKNWLLNRQNCSYELFRRQSFFFVVIYVFDAQNGKPLGDGKPITHKVHYHITVIVFPLSFRNGQWDLSLCSICLITGRCFTVGGDGDRSGPVWTGNREETGHHWQKQRPVPDLCQSVRLREEVQQVR